MLSVLEMDAEEEAWAAMQAKIEEMERSQADATAFILQQPARPVPAAVLAEADQPPDSEPHPEATAVLEQPSPAELAAPVSGRGRAALSAVDRVLWERLMSVLSTFDRCPLLALSLLRCACISASSCGLSYCHLHCVHCCACLPADIFEHCREKTGFCCPHELRHFLIQLSDAPISEEQVDVVMKLCLVSRSLCIHMLACAVAGSSSVRGALVLRCSLALVVSSGVQNDPILGVRVRDVVDNLVWVLQVDREEEMLLPHKVPPRILHTSTAHQLHSDGGCRGAGCRRGACWRKAQGSVSQSCGR